MPSRELFVAVALAAYDADDHARMPKGWAGDFDEAGPVTVDSSADTLVSGSVTLPASRKIKASARGRVLDDNNNSQDGDFWIECDGVNIGTVHRHPDLAEISNIAGWVTHEPAGGAHTYVLKASTASGDMSVASISMLIEDIGPAS